MRMFKRTLRNWIRRRTTAAFVNTLYSLRSELMMARRHRAAVRRAKQYRGQSDLALNLACGTDSKPGWINIDLLEEQGIDLRLDLREPFPFSDLTAKTIYCEHFFEHLDFPGDAAEFLRESYRVLKAGGTISIGVPDTQWPLQSYVNGDTEYFEFGKRVLGHPAWCNTRLHQINFHFRQCSEHKYAYDYGTLVDVLEDVGFCDIIRREYDPLRDSELRAVGTLYVDARKPAEIAIETQSVFALQQ